MNSEKTAEATKPDAEKLPGYAYPLCFWPAVLVAFGGALGGALGGGAGAVNLSIYKSNRPLPLKIVLNLIVGSLAFVLWFAAGIAIQMMRG